MRRSISQLGEARARLVDRWAPGFPSAAAVIVDILVGLRMSPTALGIVVGLLWAVTDDVMLAQRQMLGRARMESVLGRDRLDGRRRRGMGPGERGPSCHGRRRLWHRGGG